ncbi:MAG: glucose-6-phosphate isomerase [Candidatus Dojkabacteria bacterium]
MITVDLKNMFFDKLGIGVDAKELNDIESKLLDAKKKFLDENLGFKRLPYDFEVLKKDLVKVKKITEQMDTIVVVGIGGSDLGTRAIQRAVNGLYYNQKTTEDDKHSKNIYFSGDTTDPEAISELLEIIDLKKTMFFVVSKSGNTVEQASTFAYFRNLYIEMNSEEHPPQKHFIFLTDAITGTLRELAIKENYEAFEVPSDVGGRFSVLSTVGLIPAYLVGVNVEELLRGAQELNEKIKESKNENDDILKYVGLKYLYYKGGKNISVMMPYQYGLYEFAKWYQQLWAESLGKKLDLEGNEVHEGMTPTASVGPVDQHSQLQLYNEGPNDKVVTFIRAEGSRKSLNLPADYKGAEAFDYLKGHNFHELLNYEQETTAFSLTKNGRPNATLSIPKLDEYHLGQLFYFFEVAVSYFGYLLNINTFDQPGVELSKNAMYGVLNKKGYEEVKEEFEKYKSE